MKYRTFPRSAFQTSVLGLGGAALGGDLYRADEAEVPRALRAAIERGVNLFDTADIYQMGVSERLIGRAAGRERHRLFLATKGGALFTPLGAVALKLRPYLRPVGSLLAGFRSPLVRAKNSQRRTDFSDRHLTRALHASLQRLGTDYIDLYQLHHPDTETLRRFDYQETLGRFKREGKIRFIGVSCDSVSDALVALGNSELDAVQLQISLLEPEALDELVPQALRRGVAVLARQPLAMGLLTDAEPAQTKAERLKHKEPAYAQRLARSRALRFLAVPGRTLAQAAVRYVLQVPGITTVLTGISSVAHLDENLGAVDAPELGEPELARIREIVGGAGESKPASHRAYSKK